MCLRFLYFQTDLEKKKKDIIRSGEVGHQEERRARKMGEGRDLPGMGCSLFMVKSSGGRRHGSQLGHKVVHFVLVKVPEKLLGTLTL